MKNESPLTFNRKWPDAQIAGRRFDWVMQHKLLLFLAYFVLLFLGTFLKMRERGINLNGYYLVLAPAILAALILGFTILAVKLQRKFYRL